MNEQMTLAEAIAGTNARSPREARLKLNENRHGRDRLVYLPVPKSHAGCARERERRLKHLAKQAAKASE